MRSTIFSLVILAAVVSSIDAYRQAGGVGLKEDNDTSDDTMDGELRFHNIQLYYEGLRTKVSLPLSLKRLSHLMSGTNVDISCMF